MVSYEGALIYFLGAFTFPPLLIGLILLHAYFTFPIRQSTISASITQDDSWLGSEDGQRLLGLEVAELKGKKNGSGSGTDVAAGYFAVCREYAPGGLNGKPPERTTPTGAVIAAEGPSVYQSMYRSIFDRNKSTTIEQGKSLKRARNVFYVVLRHGHLMLYDDSEQLEVRHVVPLARYDVGIHGGGGFISEGELYIRRNAICLRRRVTDTILSVDDPASRPFFFFSEDCSEKEDFYLALLRQQERDIIGASKPPAPQKFEVSHMITLVQRLHSSEENLQTRWCNALIGRLFLALYKTPEIENIVRTKVTKKIARVKKPAFLSDVVIQKINMGSGPPFITNPRLKDLNVEGGCTVAMDVDYSGHFRLQVATKARIELSTRFKTREVDLVLAVVLKKLEGHAVFKFKPPPSNRVWFTFETMPKMEMSIEPIVSSRQITYNIILRAIESRIREVIAETAVFPNWDDIPFSDTSSQQYRGGIWATGFADQETVDFEKGRQASQGSEAPDMSRRGAGLDVKESTDSVPKSSASSVSFENEPAASQPHAATKKSRNSLSVETKPQVSTPKPLRTGTYPAAGTAIVGTDTTTVDAFKSERKGNHTDATSRMIAISSRNQSTSPVASPTGSLTGSTERPGTAGSFSTTASKEDRSDRKTAEKATAGRARADTLLTESITSTPRNPSRDSIVSMPGFGNDPTLNVSTPSPAPIMRSSSINRHSLSSISLASTGISRRFGWKQANRDGENGPSDSSNTMEGKESMPRPPIGRGRPLPPPGTPLPFPEKERLGRIATMVQKRKPLASSMAQETSSAQPLSAIENRQGLAQQRRDDNLLVVAAPPDSQPSTPRGIAADEHALPFDLNEGAADLELEPSG